MSGLTINYKKYIRSLLQTPEPSQVVNPIALDYNGLIAYARSKGIEPSQLSTEETKRFYKKK